MVNTLVSGWYCSFTAPAIQKLEDDRVIDIKLWIYGDQEVGGNIHHISKIWWWDIVFGAWYNSKTILSEEQQNYLMPKMHLFEQQLVREKLFELDSAYEIRNTIFKLIYYFKSKIEEENIQLVLFSDVPHGAYDFILYSIAKMLGRKTLFAMPSFWPDKTYILENIEDIGTFREKEGKVVVEEKYEKDIPFFRSMEFYAKFEPNFKTKWYNLTKKLANISKVVEDKKRTIKSNQKIYGNFLQYVYIHLERTFKRKIESTIFKTNYNKFFCDRIHKEEYVYFPLHLQPEMTTDTLGGEYYDQLLALEKLRNVLPSNWMIYVKENPLQKAYMRGKRFYERLLALPNIRMMGKKVDTYELLKGSKFLATINGSAGWEAISGGQSVLYFGNPWYKNFSGVTKYHDGITVQEIMCNKPNHELIEKQTFALQETAYNFYVEDYFKGLSKLSVGENIRNIHNVLNSLITK